MPDRLRLHLIKRGEKLLPARWRADVAVVPVVHLQGPIGMVGPFRSGVSLSAVAPVLEKAFAVRGAAAVALSINSPGGSPVQSRLIFKKIRDLAVKKKLPVHVFCEDVAASGGYMLALAGDDIYADPSSIIGSIGVVSASFGFDKLIEKIGVDRRVYTSGHLKMGLDPFLPEKPEDVARLKVLQADVHDMFKDMVRERRAGRLRDIPDEDIFSGAFWSGRRSVELGLVDELGDMYGVLQKKYGEDVILRMMSKENNWMRRRLGRMSVVSMAGSGVLPRATIDDAVGMLEERALWARFGV